MDAELCHDEDSHALALSLSEEWKQLCARYLPVARADLVWRYSRRAARADLEQGWKLHISATVLTANEVLKRVAPLLRARGARFKAPSSLRELKKLNSGLSYGYSQVGKFITVYPRSPEEAVSLAHVLHRQTLRMSAPVVPFDLRFRPDSCVYYRYGSFKRLEIENEDGTRTPALCDPWGKLVPDVRECYAARPDWVSDLFPEPDSGRNATPLQTPLATTFRAFQALAQRGKGGVYKALDLSANPPRLCILKEGRSGGEVAWDGRDGYWRVRQEERVLTSLRAAGVEVPRVYSSFRVEGHYYLVTEFIQGETLQALLYRRKRRLPLYSALLYGARLSVLISKIHALGWAWRDCKPANIVVMKDGMLRPLDFEGACQSDQPERLRWSTPGFTPPDTGAERPAFCDDLYALGAVIYLLLTGKLPELPLATPVERLRRHVPARVRELVADLLSADVRRQPAAHTSAEELTASLPAFQSPLFRRAPSAAGAQGGRYNRSKREAWPG